MAKSQLIDTNTKNTPANKHNITMLQPKNLSMHDLCKTTQPSPTLDTYWDQG